VKIKLLVTVKTYPTLSTRHRETVCTAGVTEDGDSVRLYPIDYRYRPHHEQYSKYQWIQVEAMKNPKDTRPESYKLVPRSNIQILGEPLGTDNNWAKRKKYVLAKGTHTMCELRGLRRTEKSLGIVRPKQITGFTIKLIERSWKDKFKAAFQQLDMFGRKQKSLDKIPYKFSYSFTCEEPDCKGHNMMIEDWEVGELYRKMVQKYEGDEQAATLAVRERFLNQVCAPTRDPYFFVGTIFIYGTWVILGVFWPKRDLFA